MQLCHKCLCQEAARKLFWEVCWGPHLARPSPLSRNNPMKRWRLEDEREQSLEDHPYLWLVWSVALWSWPWKEQGQLMFGWVCTINHNTNRVWSTGAGASCMRWELLVASTVQIRVAGTHVSLQIPVHGCSKADSPWCWWGPRGHWWCCAFACRTWHFLSGHLWQGWMKERCREVLWLLRLDFAWRLDHLKNQELHRRTCPLNNFSHGT